MRATLTMKFFSLRSRSHLHKTLHNLRVTLLCGLLTFIVLRSSLGAGKFGTPAKDYDEIRHHLHNLRLKHHNKLLSTREGLASVDATSPKDASRSTLSLPTLPSEEDGGSKASLVSTSQPRILLVIGSPHAKCEGAALEAHFLLKLLKNKMDYCHLHGIEFLLDAEIDGDSEVAMPHRLRKLSESHPEVEWIWWMDSTVMLTNMSYRLSYERYRGYNVVTHSLGNVMNRRSDGVGRSVLLRNCESTVEYLANAERLRRMPLSAEVLVDMEMKVEVYSPSVGVGNMRPFMTDLGSCNVCGKDIDFNCLSQMKRAFIFADGQHN